MPQLPAATSVDTHGALWVMGWPDGSLPQELTTEYPQSGDPFDAWIIRFTTRSGVQAFITVPTEHYHPHYVSQAITDLATEVEQVGALQGPSGVGH